MTEPLSIESVLARAVVLIPALVVGVLGLLALFGQRPSEKAVRRLTLASSVVGLGLAAAVLALMLARDVTSVGFTQGDLVHVPDYHFTVRFVFDRLSAPFVLLTFLLCSTIGLFASKYMHREPGYFRFFVLFALFQFGMVTASLAGTIETLFAGWEVVGLSSALLVGYFQERPSPVRNGLRVWSVYRVSDAALLLAAVVLHHIAGSGDFQALCGAGVWPHEVTPLTATQATLVGGLLLIAAAGKSALIPFSGWLPRAMEGPTPSSAIFYGALSVHLGVYLLLRIEPVIEASPLLAIAIVLLGLGTAVTAAIIGSVQTDIKAVLSFASLTQVGLIVAEVGAGFRYIALVHLLGHACLRTLQFLRAPTLLQDYRHMENAIGSRLPGGVVGWARLFPETARRAVYRFAIERGYLDALLADYVARPVVRLITMFDGLEKRITRRLAGTEPKAEAAPQGDWHE